MRPTDWTVYGSCRKPEHSGLPWTLDAADVSPAQTVQMGTVCRSCPVRLACAAAVASARDTEDEVTAGFWAGKQRDDIIVVLDAMPAGGIQDTLPGLDLLVLAGTLDAAGVGA